MRGHIAVRENKSGKSYFLVIRPPGEHRVKWIKVGNTRRSADRNAVRILAEMGEGEYVEPTPMTVEAYLELWLRDYVDAGYVRQRTGSAYKDIARKHLIPQLGAIRLDRLTPSRIQSYYADRLSSGRLDGRGGLSPQTVKHHHTLLSRALNLAVKWNMLSRSPMDRVEAPRVPRRNPPAFGAEDVIKLMKEAEGTQYQTIILLAAYTGLRRSELLGLRWRDLNLETGVLSVNQTLIWLADERRSIFEEPKTWRSSRPVVLSGTPIRALVSHREWQASILLSQDQETLVFCRHDGTPMLPSTVSHTIIKFARRAGLNGLTLHGLRHSNASILLELGVHPEIVRDRLGHSGISVTMDTYSHILPGVQELAADRLEERLKALSAGQMLDGC